jgi:hypothetical protein
MMDFEQVARESGVIPDTKVSSLLASLKKVPDFTWVLTSPHPTDPRLQGDILSDFPVAIVGDDGKPLCHRFVVLVLNNSCDLEPNRAKYVTVAPVLDFGAFSKHIIGKRGEKNAQSYLRDVRENRVHEILWLPSISHFKEGSVVFLERVGAVSAKIYEDAVNEKRHIASFSQNGFYFLLIKLTNHIARMESDEVGRQDAV